MGRPNCKRRGGRSALARPLRLARDWRCSRVATRCPHWQKVRVLPLLRLRQFLASSNGRATGGPHKVAPTNAGCDGSPGSPMGQSSADGADEPIVGQRPLPESLPFVTTLEQDKETTAWLGLQNRKTKHTLRAKIYMESMAMRREDRVGTLWRRAELSEANAKKMQHIIEHLEAEARIVAAQSPAAAATMKPRFRAGQSVFSGGITGSKTRDRRRRCIARKKGQPGFLGRFSTLRCGRRTRSMRGSSIQAGYTPRTDGTAPGSWCRSRT